jgi:hypothetical protein
MKLTKHTIPQARDYQCNKCKDIYCHKDMVNESICWNCIEKEEASLSSLDGTK